MALVYLFNTESEAITFENTCNDYYSDKIKYPVTKFCKYLMSGNIYYVFYNKSLSDVPGNNFIPVEYDLNPPPKR